MTLTPTRPGDTVPAEVRDLVSSLSTEGTGRDTFLVVDPATGERVAEVPDAAASDAAAAVDAAAAAFPAWAATPPRRRSEVLHRAFELMVTDLDRLAGLIALENGKSLPDARAEVTYAAEFFRWFAEEAVRPDGGYGEAPAGGTRTIVTSRPVGVAALVTPWNFPAAMATRKVGPALAAGCTVVLKPAAETPLTALAVADVLRAAGVPDGVVNVVATTRPGDVVGTWLADRRVRKISFTGSTGVGRTLLAQAAERVVSSSMELGGNAPFVVAADADLEAAVAGAMVAKFRNGGQACTAANRFYVHADVAEEFTSRFGAAVEALTVGHAFTPGTEIGPLVSDRAVDGVRGWVERALAAGARVSHQAPTPVGPSSPSGAFFPPTVLVDLPRRRRGPAGRDLRPGRPGRHLAHRGRAARRRQRHGARPGGVRLLTRPRLGAAPRRARRRRHGGRQPRRRVRPVRTLRRREAVRPRPRGRPRGPPRVHRDPVLLRRLVRRPLRGPRGGSRGVTADESRPTALTVHPETRK